MPGRIDFEVNLSAASDSSPEVLRRSETMRILVLGDLSGRANRGLETTAGLAERPVLAVDLDDFDAVLRRLAPCLRLMGPGSIADGIDLKFELLDDFHPDRLFGSIELFRKLRESRDRLADPASFEEEAARLMSGQGPPASPESPETPGAASEAEDPAGLLERLIGSPQVSPGPRTPAQGAVSDIVRRLAQPHIKLGPSQSPEPYLAALDVSATEIMRALLHEPDFQALEAAWRGLRRIVDQVELGSEVKLDVADVTKEELLQDLAESRGRLEDSAAHRLIVGRSRQGADGEPWSMIIGLHDFRASPDDIALLGHLGRIAAQAGGPYLAAAHPELVGCDHLSEDAEPKRWAFTDSKLAAQWDTLRRSPVAPWLGLALPRILLRLPYGRNTDRIEAFQLEEFPAAPRHEDYLWGSPALACAEVAARRFADGNSDTGVEEPWDIEDLPADVRDIDGERRLQPCAEFLLPVRIGEELLNRGMIPLLSYGNRNAVRILRVQSIAEPPRALPGLARG